MKRRIVALLLVAFVAGLVSVAAESTTSTFYPVRLDIVKVYSHADGYRVMYRKGMFGVTDFYVPIGWFIPGGKAELVKGHDTSYPYAVVYYKDGKFDHLKLYVESNFRDPSWGQLSQDEGKGKFDNIQEPAITF
jgi:hypothetical protein